MRLANLVGHAQNTSQLIPALVHQIEQGRVTLFARATRDLLDVDDFVRLLLGVLATQIANDKLVIASGCSVSVVDLVRELQCRLGLEAEIVLRDEGDQQRFDVSKLKRLLPDDVHFAPDYYQAVLAKYVQRADEGNR